MGTHTFTLPNGTVTIRSQYSCPSYAGRDSRTRQMSIALDFQTKHCRDTLFVSTEEEAWFPKEIIANVREFDRFVTELAKERDKLMGIYNKQMDCWGSEQED